MIFFLFAFDLVALLYTVFDVESAFKLQQKVAQYLAGQLNSPLDDELEVF